VETGPEDGVYDEVRSPHIPGKPWSGARDLSALRDEATMIGGGGGGELVLPAKQVDLHFGSP